jgi:hypothetical protein
MEFCIRSSQLLDRVFWGFPVISGDQRGRGDPGEICRLEQTAWRSGALLSKCTLRGSIDADEDVELVAGLWAAVDGHGCPWRDP